MNSQISLKQTERKLFHSQFDDSLIDIGIGGFMLIFALAPLLSETLGDFWSSMIFLPFWAIGYLLLRSIKRKMVAPRVGTVSYGAWRLGRLRRFTLVMVLLNLALLILGIIALWVSMSSSWTVALIFGGVWLIGFSLAGYFLDYGMLYLYGLLYGLAPVAGEWLAQNLGASHHGFPITFGIACVIVVLIGTAKLVRLLINNPLPAEME
jgi:hypothetical protein